VTKRGVEIGKRYKRRSGIRKRRRKLESKLDKEKRSGVEIEKREENRSGNRKKRIK